MSHLLFHRLSAVYRRRKTVQLTRMMENQLQFDQLTTKIQANEQSCQQMLLEISLAWQQLTKRPSASVDDIYQVRLTEAKLQRQILQSEAEMAEWQNAKQKLAAEISQQRQQVRYLTIKEEKMTQGQALTLMRSGKR